MLGKLTFRHVDQTIFPTLNCYFSESVLNNNVTNILVRSKKSRIPEVSNLFTLEIFFVLLTKIKILTHNLFNKKSTSTLNYEG